MQTALIFYERIIFIFTENEILPCKFSINILAYCLMPNHFHLFVQQTTDEFSISIFLSSLLNSYVKAVNQAINEAEHYSRAKQKQADCDRLISNGWLNTYLKTRWMPDYFNIRLGIFNAMVINYAEWDISDINNVASFFNPKKAWLSFNRQTVKTSYNFRCNRTKTSLIKTWGFQTSRFGSDNFAELFSLFF